LQAQKTLGQLKIAITQIPSLFGAPTDSSSPAQFAQETQIALDSFELGALLSLKIGDMNAFERHISQAKTIYFDYKLAIPDPQNQAVLTGLHLMHLLSQTRIAEFHTALETVTPALQSHPCIQVLPISLPSPPNAARHTHPPPVPCLPRAIPHGGRVPQHPSVPRLHPLPPIQSISRLARIYCPRRNCGATPPPHALATLTPLQECSEDAYAMRFHP
jgi:hypothetical protein